MAEFADDDDGVSNEEKLQIAQHFLLSSPPGQFQEILGDVRKLLPDGLLEEPLAQGMARAYNNKTYKVVTSPSGAKVVVCTAGEVDPTHYIDSKSGNCFALDHLSLVTTNDDSSAPDNSNTNESARVAVQSAFDGYVKDKYLCEDAAAGVFSKEGDNLVVVVTGERPNLRNFWSGKWTSIWNISLQGDQGTIEGEIKVHAHYFEDGNVQLQSSKKIPSATVSFSSDKDLATKLVDVVLAAESSVQVGLEDMYANMAEETFRAMRRIMPVKRTKMDWNINSVRMNRQVRK